MEKNYDYYADESAYGPGGEVPMNFINDACASISRKDKCTKPMSAAEVQAAITRARNRGYRVSGPDADGSYVVLSPHFTDERGAVHDGSADRVPNADFLVEFLALNRLVHIVISRKPEIEDVSGAAARR